MCDSNTKLEELPRKANLHSGYNGHGVGNSSGRLHYAGDESKLHGGYRFDSTSLSIDTILVETSARILIIMGFRSR